MERFAHGRRDARVAVLEGYHALAHAVRFGATVEVVVAAAGVELPPLPAGDGSLEVLTVADDLFDRLVRAPLPDRVVALARRPEVDPAALLAGPGPIVLLEDPSHLGNLGAVIRVAAAAEAGGVLVAGRADPWQRAAVRGAAGLQFALPIARIDRLPTTLARPLVAVHPDGSVLLGCDALPPEPVLAFGNERRGLTRAIVERADLTVRIPMRAGVSSLNLATAVAITLYTGYLGGRIRRRGEAGL